MQALAWFGNENVKVIEARIPDITQDVRYRAVWSFSLHKVTEQAITLQDDVVLKVTGTTVSLSLPALSLRVSLIFRLRCRQICGYVWRRSIVESRL